MVITLPTVILHHDYGLDLSDYSGFGEAFWEGRKRKAGVAMAGPQLTALMVEYSVGIRFTRKIELKRLNEDFFTKG